MSDIIYPPLNESLFERVIAHILEEPRRFDMAHWARRSTEAPCGTAACIAGWASSLHNNWTPEELISVWHNLDQKGAEALGLDIKEARRLFFTDNWPPKFRDYYEEAEMDDDKERMTEVAVARIRAFLVEARERRAGATE